MLDGYIRQYGRRLFGLCMSLCAGRDAAEDLYQETWLRALRAMPRYDPGMDFEPWITKICVNVYRNMVRRSRRSPVEEYRTVEAQDAALEAARAPERPDYGPLYDAVDALPEKLRVTVILYYFRDMDVASAARALGVPEGTVKSRLSRARGLLKEALKDDEL